MLKYVELDYTRSWHNPYPRTKEAEYTPQVPWHVCYWTHMATHPGMLTEGFQKMHRAKYTNNIPSPSCWYKEQLLETLMPDKPKPTVCLSASHMVTGVFGTVQIQQSLHTEPCMAVENHCTSQGGHIPRQCPVPAARLHRFEQDWLWLVTVK